MKLKKKKAASSHNISEPNSKRADKRADNVHKTRRRVVLRTWKNRTNPAFYFFVILGPSQPTYFMNFPPPKLTDRLSSYLVQ